MAVGERAVGQLDFVMDPFVVILIHFHGQKRQRQQQRAGVEKFEFAELSDLARNPCEQRRDGREREDERVERAKPDVEPAVRPGAGRGADTQQNVGGKKAAEEHDFGREKKPDAELGVVKSDVRSGLNCVGNIHELNQCAVEVVGADKGSGGSFCGVKSVAWPGTLYS